MYLSVSRLLLSLLVLLTLSIFSGCSQQEQPSVPTKKPTQPKEASPPVLYVPKWVTYPECDGYIGVVGYAKKQRTKKLQKKIALITAKAALSERLKINIDDMNVGSASNHSDSSRFHTRSRLISSNHIHRVIVKDEFIDNDGTLYIWLIQQ